ncbi:endonuclease/exonuclease/phosphatase family protein [Bartonella sp. DGB1]|uniref:endonuclease/exonuclease/phosphatase family protein n=1 Tax=Bartonella sp. DGB1 TaxID=3239807 RepID=UPI0035235F9D
MNKFKIASYNIHKCIGIDKKFDPYRIIKVIAEINPDIICLQEADKRFGNKKGLLDLKYLEQITGLKTAPIITKKPNSHGWHGNLLLFRRFKLAYLQQITLPKIEPRGALITELQINNKNLLVISAHLGLLKKTRIKQIKYLMEILAKYPSRPVILLGDFNEWRRTSNSSLNYLNHLFNITQKNIPTFPANFPILPLDKIFANPTQIISQIKAHDTILARKASDHLPITAILHTDRL